MQPKLSQFLSPGEEMPPLKPAGVCAQSRLHSSQKQTALELSATVSVTISAAKKLSTLVTDNRPPAAALPPLVA